MTDYLFILGKNWTLSIAELLVSLGDLRIDFKVKDYSRTSVVIETDRQFTDEELVEIQAGLGGCFKTGRVVTSYELGLILRAFPRRGRIVKEAREKLEECSWLGKVWPRPAGARIKYGVSTYPAAKDSPVDLGKLTLGLDEFIKRRLTQLGAKKASYYAYEGPDKRKPERPSTALWPQTIALHSLLVPPNAEILAALTTERMYLARTIAVYDSLFQRHRDESRPYISAQISTSPKLCRTLLTLSGAKPGCTVLDPFCGTGTILMEAAVLDMRCIGVDNSHDAVQGARRNMVWLAKEMGEQLVFRIEHGDARKLPETVKEQVDAVAFEPDLGPVYEEAPSREEAESSVAQLTELYRDCLVSLQSVLRPGGRVGMTVPVVVSKQGPVLVNLDKMVENTAFTVHTLLPREVFPDSVKNREVAIRPERTRLPERKRGQIVQREVLMLGLD
ncbi:MAG: methyltransferase domain-containing protein [Candidatus Thorarchaeota archaeon]|nr:methyltransferase domain-containing protein [Candidatus Thorarchaeota archaeon]